jgi:hypothetical protein
MIPPTRRHRRRVFGAGLSALLLGLGLTLAMSVAGGARLAAADASGTVYAGSVGGAGVLTVNAARAGGSAPGSISGLPAGAAVNPIVVNPQGTVGVAGLVSTFGQFLGVDAIDVAHNKVIGPIKVSLAPVGFAMDPSHAVAWSVENSFGNPQIARVERLDLTTLTATTWVNSLPTDPGGTPVTASSAAIAPDGQTLFVAWGSNNGNDGGFYGVDSVPIGGTPNPPVTRWSSAPTVALNFATPTQVNSPNGNFVYLMATDLAVAPNGSDLFVTSVGQTLPGVAAPQAGSVFNLSLPLTASERPAWSVGFLASQTSLAEPLAVKVSPDGNTVYVGGVSYPGPDDVATSSFVRAFDAVTHAVKATATIQVTPTFDPSGVSALGLTPDGQTLLVEALNTSPTQTVLYPLAAPGLTPTGSPTVLASGTPANDFSSIYGPLDVAIGPAQAGPPPTTTPTTPETTPTSSNTTPSTPSTTGPGTTSTTTGHNGRPTTTTTVPGQKPPGRPTLILNPAVGPPGTIVTVTGHGFKPNTPVTVSWTVSTGSVVITADALGNLPPRALLILTPDVLGPRLAQASSSPPATAPFLVVPATSEPGGDNAGLLFRSEGP